MAAPLVTSGTFSATQSVVTILNAALRNAQVIGAEETATGAQLQNGLDAMTAMCKAWQGSAFMSGARKKASFSFSLARPFIRSEPG